MINDQWVLKKDLAMINLPTSKEIRQAQLKLTFEKISELDSSFEVRINLILTTFHELILRTIETESKIGTEKIKYQSLTRKLTEIGLTEDVYSYISKHYSFFREYFFVRGINFTLFRANKYDTNSEYFFELDWRDI